MACTGVPSTFMRGLVVERADNQSQLDAEVIGLVRQGDGLLRGSAAGASDDGLAACGGLDIPHLQ